MDAHEIETGRRRWQARYDSARKRAADFQHALRRPGRPGVRAAARRRRAGVRADRLAGEYPFTRGLHATGYRGRTWTIRQFAGFGNAEQTNERYKMILAAGGGGLSVAFDMPTLMGRDSDDPRSLGEVGHCGVAIDSAVDMEALFRGIPLGEVTTSMTISGPAVPVFCMYLVAAERQGVDPAVLNGTLQTDIFKEYIAQKEWLFAPDPHLRLIGDLMEHCAAGIPAYKPLSVSGYHIREAGSTAAQELAYTLADGFGYVELGLSRGLTSTSSRRACRSSSTRTWTSFERSPSSARPAGSGPAGCAMCTGPRSDKAQWLRFHTQTAGVSLTAQQPYNNVVRTAVEALSAVLGGTNSLHTNALDETLALPSEQAAEIALRTQQVLMEETGVANVADPLGGSWYVEALTDRIERDAEKIFDRIKGAGVRSIRSVSASTYHEPPSGSATLATPVSSISTCWVRSAISAACSLAAPASRPGRWCGSELVAAEHRGQCLHGGAHHVVVRLLGGQRHPAVWVWKRSHCALSDAAPYTSRIQRAQIRRAARNLRSPRRSPGARRRRTTGRRELVDVQARLRPSST